MLPYFSSPLWGQRRLPTGLISPVRPSSGLSAGSTTFPYLLGVSAVKCDFSRYHIVNYASQGATSLDIIPMLAFEMLGIDVKAIFRYKGGGSLVSEPWVQV